MVIPKIIGMMNESMDTEQLQNNLHSAAEIQSKPAVDFVITCWVFVVVFLTWALYTVVEFVCGEIYDL